MNMRKKIGEQSSHLLDREVDRADPPRVPHCNLPRQMIVAIDGTAQSGKNTVAEIVAEAIGGVVVDSERVYRALAKACVESGIALSDRKTIGEFCLEAALNIRVEWDGGTVKEALPFVNGLYFTKEELKSVTAEAWKVARLPAVREAVNRGLR